MNAILLLALAAGPTATFRFEGGDIVATVRDGGAPVSGAVIKVYSGGSSPPLVDGETGAKGNGRFPLPGDAGLVGITIDGKECDLIPLSVKDGEATPPRVLLTFGTRPCCVGAKKADAPAERPVPYALYAVLGASVVLATATVVVALASRRRQSPE